MTRPATQKPSTAESKRLLALRRLGMEQPWEALLCCPSGHFDCTEVHMNCDSETDEVRAYALTFTGTMTTYDAMGNSYGGFDWRWKPRRVSMEFADDNGQPVWITLFGDFGSWIETPPGTEFVVAGSTRRFGRSLFVTNATVVPRMYVGKVWPQYTGIPGRVSKQSIEDIVQHALSIPQAIEACSELVHASAGGLSEQAVLSYAGVEDKFRRVADLITALHMPTQITLADAARSAAKRIGALSVKAAAMRTTARDASPLTPLRITEEALAALADAQTEKLSVEQMACISGIRKCLEREMPMVGLLAGDVGTGKTLTYLLPIIEAHRAGAKCAIIAPTQILADQIADQIHRRFTSLGAVVERVITGKKINDQSAILVGTHGMGAVAKKAKYAPDFLVVDEQHKMGTAAREAMLGPRTHLLEVSATPIPRTLASALYGGYEIFTLAKCPVHKQIESRVIDLTQRPIATALLRDAIARGEKAAVIYPVVSIDDPDAGPLERNDESNPQPYDLQSVLKAAATLEQHFPGKVCVLHGGMSNDEKREAIESINSNTRPLVVGSTILETGIDIPSITTMVVRDAERFGASQLHQLRGRLARNGGKAHFIMMVNSIEALPESTLDRLGAVAATTDGFKIAEQDMLLRGFGSLSDQSQSGATRAVFQLIQLSAEDFMRIELDQEAKDLSRDRTRPYPLRSC